MNSKKDVLKTIIIFLVALTLRITILGIVFSFFSAFVDQNYTALSYVFEDIAYFIFYATFLIPLVDVPLIIFMTRKEEKTLSLWLQRGAMLVGNIVLSQAFVGIFLLGANMVG
ncbi:hypothetical protein LRY58_02925 [Candidatus Woesebacteria bacterium]|nr:hypothetical protein [Candidatus Woesebacteria bacterium]MCD8546035.1 hypothetical protein [Candidatus Woesebacteria bacterium]